jgi:hypothetical protein
MVSLILQLRGPAGTGVIASMMASMLTKVPIKRLSTSTYSETESRLPRSTHSHHTLGHHHRTEKRTRHGDDADVYSEATAAREDPCRLYDLLCQERMNIPPTRFLFYCLEFRLVPQSTHLPLHRHVERQGDPRRQSGKPNI